MAAGHRGSAMVLQQNRQGESLKCSQPGLASRYFFSLMALTQDASSTSKTLLTFLHPVQHAAIQSCCLHQEICSILQLKG